jgi:hypothetical protein
MGTQETVIFFISLGIFCLIISLFINPRRPATKNIKSGKQMRGALWGSNFYRLWFDIAGCKSIILLKKIWSVGKYL